MAFILYRIFSLSNSKLDGTVPLMGGSGFKLLTTAKTLPVGVHLIRLTNGSDTSELPSGIGTTPVQYSYAIVSVRSVNDMICVQLFCGIAEANEGVWINQSNGGTFWGWKKLATKPTVTSTSREVTAPTANTWFYTGLTLTIPANSVANIRVRSNYINARCAGLAVSTTNNPLQDWFFVGHSDNSFTMSCVYATGANAETLYIHAKFTGASSNTISCTLITQSA